MNSLLRITKLLRCRACLGVFLPTPSHRAASAAKGKGSAGPVRRRRKTGTLYVTREIRKNGLDIAGDYNYWYHLSSERSLPVMTFSFG